MYVRCFKKKQKFLTNAKKIIPYEKKVNRISKATLSVFFGTKLKIYPPLNLKQKNRELRRKTLKENEKKRTGEAHPRREARRKTIKKKKNNKLLSVNVKVSLGLKNKKKKLISKLNSRKTQVKSKALIMIVCKRKLKPSF